MFRNLLLCVLLGSAHFFTLPKDKFNDNDESSGSDAGIVNATISARLKKANRNLGKRRSGPVVRELDIAVGFGLENADPCTNNECIWPKNNDGNVYVPYRLSDKYSKSQKARIEAGLRSISSTSCIRFIPRVNHKDFLDISSIDGCYSYVGRQSGGQEVSLDVYGCLDKSTIQHELMHALGFNHEHSRSDRDKHVKILWNNVMSGERENFVKMPTNNLNTPYDYNSVMQYERDFFSKNGEPTILPFPNKNVAMGVATDMSANDILRINRLYKCSKELKQAMEMDEGNQE